MYEIMSQLQKKISDNDWVVTHPDLLGGTPCIKGTRLSVSFVLKCLSEGMTPEEISNDYPGFPKECINEILKFASENVAS